MIKTEELTVNGRLLVLTYSDAGYMVERDGIRYDKAIDPAEFNRQYIETDELVEDEASEQELSAEEALDIILGGEF